MNLIIKNTFKIKLTTESELYKPNSYQATRKEDYFIVLDNIILEYWHRRSQIGSEFEFLEAACYDKILKTLSANIYLILMSRIMRINIYSVDCNYHEDS